MVLSIERDCELTKRQLNLLKGIHVIAREMEKVKNNGKAHCVVALLEELSSGCIASKYLVEKLNLLFDAGKFTFEYYESDE